MNIHPGISTAFFPDHAEELPAVPLVKSDMVCDQIEEIYLLLFHILTDPAEHFPGQALASMGFFHIHRAHIGGQILPAMEVILNNAQSSHNGFPLQQKIPLGNGGFLPETGLHTFQIRLPGNAPLLVKPIRSGAFPLGMLPDFQKAIFVQ